MFDSDDFFCFSCDNRGWEKVLEMSEQKTFSHWKMNYVELFESKTRQSQLVWLIGQKIACGAPFG